MNEDGSYTNNEKATVMIQVNKTCTSTGCTPTQWGTCTCQGSNTNGLTTGHCVDNCGSQLAYTNPCGCQVQLPQNTTPPSNNTQPNGNQPNTSNNNGANNNNGQTNNNATTQPDNTPILIGLGAIFLAVVVIGGLFLLKKPPTAPEVKKPEPKPTTKKDDVPSS